MDRKRSKRSTYRRYALTATLLLSAFVFSCRGLTPAHAADAHAGAPMPGMGHRICCWLSDADASALMHGQFQSALPAPYVLLVAALLAFAAASFSARAVSFAAAPYGRGVQRRFGSARSFVYYVRLFSQGILHPKIF
ncbi:MAG: hypothetical protein HYS45_02515 [Parcubacteria group bacterium]|nr:hypothetical protein [Parcubacteria group bacterium]MBI2637049.1 hypothetical protein [Parcubacteria group bacterium]